MAKLFESHAPKRVLDIGCNSGVYSRIAAKRGASVVAIDSDPVVVGKAWRSAYEESLDILPLVVDLARPTPATGWWNTETQSFLQRARGHFELVLMLAVIHHLRVSDGIPTSEIARLTATMTTRLAVVEFVPPNDPMFVRIARGRSFPDVSVSDFESAFGRYFNIQWREKIEGSERIVYVLQKRETIG